MFQRNVVIYNRFIYYILLICNKISIYSIYQKSNNFQQFDFKGLAQSLDGSLFGCLSLIPHSRCFLVRQVKVPLGFIFEKFSYMDFDHDSVRDVVLVTESGWQPATRSELVCFCEYWCGERGLIIKVFECDFDSL